MRQNRRFVIAGLILWILAGGLPAHAQPPTESPDWVPAEPLEDEPLEEPEPAEEPPLEEPMDLEEPEAPLEPPLEEPPLDPMDEPMEPMDEPAAAPAVELPKVPEPPKVKAPAVVKKPAPPRGETFRVRLAEAGKGFRQGVVGRLRVTASGLAFTPDGGTGAGWSISWKELTAARKEGGLWDAPFVLGLVKSDGQKRFIARLDPNGRYLDGAPILAAIVRTGGAKFK